MKEDSNKLKEYLVKNIRGDYVVTDHHSGFQVEDLIEIPEGAEYMTMPNNYFWRNGDENYSWNGWEWGDNCGETMQDYLATARLAKVVWRREKETVNTINNNEFNPLIPQEGGDHYKLRPIQPIEYSERNGLSMSQGNIVKYITRHKEKNGVEDLAKVVHYALLEAYFVYDIKGSTELKQRILKMLGD